MNSRFSNAFDDDMELESNLSFTLSDTWGAAILCPSAYLKSEINHYINYKEHNNILQETKFNMFGLDFDDKNIYINTLVSFSLKGEYVKAFS